MLDKLEDKFMTTAKFSQDIEKIAFDNAMNYIDAIVFTARLMTLRSNQFLNSLANHLRKNLSTTHRN